MYLLGLNDAKKTSREKGKELSVVDSESHMYMCVCIYIGFPGGTSCKEPASNAGGVRDAGSFPGLGRSPGGGRGNPLQYSYLEIPVDRGGWQATVHRFAQIQT